MQICDPNMIQSFPIFNKLKESMYVDSCAKSKFLGCNKFAHKTPKV